MCEREVSHSSTGTLDDTRARARAHARTHDVLNLCFISFLRFRGLVVDPLTVSMQIQDATTCLFVLGF